VPRKTPLFSVIYYIIFSKTPDLTDKDGVLRLQNEPGRSSFFDCAKKIKNLRNFSKTHPIMMMQGENCPFCWRSCFFGKNTRKGRR